MGGTLTHLGSIYSNQVKRAHGAVKKTGDLHEIFISNRPGSINKEHQVSFGLFTH